MMTLSHRAGRRRTAYRLAGIVAVLCFLGGCGGASKIDTGGFSAKDRKAAQNALATLGKTSAWQVALRTTLTESKLPVDCAVHIERRKPLTFKLFIAWVPDPTVQSTVFEGQPRADVWLRAVIGPEGLRGPYSLRLGNEHSLTALRSQYGDALEKPVDRCALLANGTFALLSSELPPPSADAIVRTTEQQHSRAGVDPDQDPLGNPDVAIVVTSLGHQHYQLTVENTSPDGHINDFVWKPWPGAKLIGITGRSSRYCRLSGGMIACKRRLSAPACLCHPGGSVTVDFTATTPDDNAKPGATRHGFVDSYVWVGSITLVPYIIPAHLGRNVPQ